MRGKGERGDEVFRHDSIPNRNVFGCPAVLEETALLRTHLNLGQRRGGSRLMFGFPAFPRGLPMPGISPSAVPSALRLFRPFRQNPAAGCSKLMRPGSGPTSMAQPGSPPSGCGRVLLGAGPRRSSRWCPGLPLSPVAPRALPPDASLAAERICYTLGREKTRATLRRWR